VTSEFASTIATHLESKNRETASLLAKAGSVRLAFQFARLKHNFPNLRTHLARPELSDIQCLVFCLKDLLSNNGQRIVDNAIKRWARLQKLSNEIMPKSLASGKKGVEFGSVVLKKDH